MYNGRVRHLKKGDMAVALSGNEKGKFGKVVEVSHKRGVIKVDGLGVVKKHAKPTQENPKGGIVEMNRWLPSCKFGACDAKGKKLGRVGFTGTGKEKKRVYSSQKK